MKSPFNTIRGKVSAIAVAVSAVAMVAVVAVVGLAAASILETQIESSLNERLNSIESRLQSGESIETIRGTGSDLIQIIDENGEVSASSDWAQDISAISTGGLQPGESSSHTEDAMLLQRLPSSNADDIHSDVMAESLAAAREHIDETESSPAQNETPPSSAQPAPTLKPAPAPQGDDGNSGYDDQSSASANSGYANNSSNEANSGYSANSGYEANSGYADSNSGYDSNSEYGSAREASYVRTSTDAGGMPVIHAVAAPAPQDTAADAAASDPSPQSLNVDASQVLGSKGPYLVMERGVQTPNGVVTIAAMTSIASAQEAGRTAAALLGGVLALALIAIAGFSWFLTSRALAPVETMRAEAARISISNLEQRIPVPENDKDLSKLAKTFNDMLSRLEASVAEQHRFVSDASHELKSPIAAMKLMLETLREHPDAVDIDELAADLLSENERVGGIVGNLLLLARQDEGVAKISKTPLDLYDLLIEEAASLSGRTDKTIDTSGIAPLVATADHEAISHATRNLLDNAARYAETTVALSCKEAQDESGSAWIEIIVDDDGPGIPPADRERVFGRFVRLEEGRDRKKGSTGLGLAVVREIARQHGGDALFADSPLGGARAILRLPEEA